jgi:hypothetical protein
MAHGARYASSPAHTACRIEAASRAGRAAPEYGRRAQFHRHGHVVRRAQTALDDDRQFGALNDLTNSGRKTSMKGITSLYDWITFTADSQLALRLL